MRELPLEGRVRVRKRKVPPPLVWPRAVVDHAAREVVVPRAHDVEEKRLLHVDEHRDVVRRDGHAALGVSVQVVHDPVHGELLLGAQVLRQRVVLILGPERRLVRELQVHRVLDGRQFIMVVAGGPCHDRSLVHLGAVSPVEFRRLGERPPLAQLVGAEVGVAVPKLIVLRELVEHLAPLPVPFGMLRAVEHLLGHVAGADDGAGHHAGDLASGAGEAEDIAREDANALAGLLGGAGGLARLRVVHDHELRADGAPVGALVLHAANASRYAGDAHDRARRGRAHDGGKDDLARGPRDARPLPLVELPRAAVGDPLETGYWIDHLREILGEMLVDLKLGLDGVEHLQRRALARADDDHELAVAVGHSPYRRRLGERRLAASARHRQGEKPAFEDGLLYLVYRPQMVVRPFEAVHLRKIRLAELPEVRAARLLALGVGDLRQLADVAPRERLVGLPLRRRLAVRRVAARRPLLDWSVVPVHDPRDVAVEAQTAGILRRGDAVARRREVPVELRGRHDRAELRGVE